MPGPNRSGREDDAAVRQPDLAVLDAFGSGLALLFLEAVGVVDADPGRDLLVIVVVAERVPQAELAGRRQPLDRVGLRVELVVELRRAHAERAQVVGEHRHVLDLGMELALEPDAGGVRPAEELVGNQAVVHAEPVRELTLRASHGGQRRDADTHAHEPVEGPGQVARADDLRRIALRCVRRPDVEVVAHLRREEPPRERREELLQLDVLAPLDGLRVAEGVDVGLVQIPLVQIARVAEEPEIDLALVAVEEQEADVRNVREGLGLLRLRFLRPRRCRTRRCSRPTPRRWSGRSPRSFRADTARPPVDRSSTTPADVSAEHCVRSPGFEAHATVTGGCEAFWTGSETGCAEASCALPERTTRRTSAMQTTEPRPRRLMVSRATVR